jgi:hypothetical protein
MENSWMPYAWYKMINQTRNFLKYRKKKLKEKRKKRGERIQEKIKKNRNLKTLKNQY